LKKRFSDKDKLKCLLWSNRHCCVCDVACGLDIEVAHIDPKGGNKIDNAIPVCYLHHAQIGRYNTEHPRGTKYRIEELTKRREQIYEKHTKHLIPPLIFSLRPRKNDPKNLQFQLPRVGFLIENHGNHISARFKVNAKVFLGIKELKPKTNPEKPYYTNGILWNLNPGHNFFGNFSIPKECDESKNNLWIEIQITVIDEYDREHELLPICHYYVRDNKHWFTEPTSFGELKRFMKK
jgi:hypothetical protein